MLKLLIVFLGLSAIAHGKQTKIRSLSRFRRAADGSENSDMPMAVYNNETVTSMDESHARNASTYFVSALLERYNESNRLSLDGFVRLLCRLGLIPGLSDTNAAANTLHFDCKRITFKQVPATFRNFQTSNESEHEHDGHEDHDHSVDHGDHDHQPNRNSGKTNSAQFSSAENHHDHAYEHDHGDESNSASPKVNNGSVGGKNADSPTKASLSKRQVIPGSDSSASDSAAHDHSSHLQKCASPRELLALFHIPLSDLDVQQITLICPALLYSLDAGNCRPHDHDHHDQDVEGEGQSELKTIPLKVWGYSTAAVLVISLAGLLGVAVIPIMQKVLYNHLLQFLVAIAVGALSGDALLHLLPHAIAKNQIHHHDLHQHSHSLAAEQQSHEAEHLEAVWKGVVALVCIFFFFLVERVLTIVTEKKRRKKAMSRQEKKRCERLCDAEKSSRVGAKLSAHDDHGNCEQMVMVVHPNRALKGFADATHDVVMHQCDESLTHEAYEDHEHDNFDSHEQNSSSVALGQPHAHAHGHGHSHFGSVPSSVAAVAWMVIFGDGIHNFSDGLAIGAAFASSVTGGISTSIAVFCHELPHEIGDFAVLLRAGMSVKQAVVYNCLSSVLCFMGMLVGVAIGNLTSASLWIFAGVGGMFIYISMVDMLPEMTAVDTKKGENQFLHMFLQVCGMMIGSGIMLLIAVFEHDLQQLLD